MSNYAIHVNSCHLRQIMPFVPNHAICAKSCHLYQIMPFVPNHVIHFNHAKSCHSGQIMSFMSIYVIHVKSLDFSRNSVKSGGGRVGVKYVFLSLRRQLRCQAEGKNGFYGVCVKTLSFTVDFCSIFLSKLKILTGRLTLEKLTEIHPGSNLT
jgi:hypothetical protein